MTQTEIPRPAFILGFAGLLPQIGAAIAALSGVPRIVELGVLAAGLYAMAILSFLGGIWWGFAMRRGSGGSGLAALAVLPSLIGVGCLLAVTFGLRAGWALVALGVALVLTLPVDRRLEADGDAPAGWMRLRAPLSLGLGTLTALIGAVLP